MTKLVLLRGEAAIPPPPITPPPPSPGETVTLLGLGATDEDFARLPFVDGQSALAKGGVAAGAAIRARAGWHGRSVDERLGAYVIVNPAGVCAALAGRKLRLTLITLGHTKVVYVVADRAYEVFEGDDLSLPRRSFLALALLSAEGVDVLADEVVPA